MEIEHVLCTFLKIINKFFFFFLKTYIIISKQIVLRRVPTDMYNVGPWSSPLAHIFIVGTQKKWAQPYINNLGLTLDQNCLV